MNMKKIILSMLFLLGVMQIFAQRIAPTTEEEFNYVSKGYRIQKESGLDDKRGYYWVNLVSHYAGTRNMDFKALVRSGENKPCAILMIYNRTDSGFLDYICIPTYDAPKYLWDKTWDKIRTYSQDAAYALIWGLMHSTAYFAQ